MARAIAPRNPTLQNTQVARATPPLAAPPNAHFRAGGRRPALAFPPTRPSGMRDARHLARDRVRDGCVRRNATARRGRRDSSALQCGRRSSHGSAERLPPAHRG